MTRHLRTLDRALGALEALVVVAALAAIVVATGLGVVFRYLLNDPLMWSNDVGTLALMWLTFIGAALVMKTEGHIAIDLFATRLAGPARRLHSALLAALVVAATLVIVVAMLKILPVQQKMEISSIGLPRSTTGLPVLWMAVSMLVHIAASGSAGRGSPGP